MHFTCLLLNPTTDVTLDIKSISGRPDRGRTGYIIVCLSTIDPAQGAAIAVGNARQDADRRGLGRSAAIADSETTLGSGVLDLDSDVVQFAKALQNVVSKLNLFVQMVDAIAKVITNRSLLLFSY